MDVSEGSWVAVALGAAGVPESSITGVGVRVGSVAAVRVGVLGLTSPKVGKGEFVGLDSGDAVGNSHSPHRIAALRWMFVFPAAQRLLGRSSLDQTGWTATQPRLLSHKSL